MKKMSMCLVLFAMFVGINGCSNKTEKMQVKKQLVEQSPSDFKPAFTKETVIKLNGIVSQQLEVIDQYDAMKGAKNNDENMAKLIELEIRAKVNLGNMISAEKQLIESGETYNKATFAGMMDFVKDVQRELSAKVVMIKKHKAMAMVKSLDS